MFKDIQNLYPVLQHTYKNAPNTNSFVLFDNVYRLWQLKRNINRRESFDWLSFHAQEQNITRPLVGIFFASPGFEKKIKYINRKYFE